MRLIMIVALVAGCGGGEPEGNIVASTTIVLGKVFTLSGEISKRGEPTASGAYHFSPIFVAFIPQTGTTLQLLYSTSSVSLAPSCE